MSRNSGLFLMSGLILGGACIAYGQMGGPMPGRMGGMGGPMGQMPPAALEMQKAQMQLMKEASPELYAYQKELQGIEEKIGKIVQSFSKKEMDKAAAKAELLPLVARAQKIRDNPDFQAEQRLSQVYFSSPEYQEKFKKVMEKFNQQRPQQAPAPQKR